MSANRIIWKSLALDDDALVIELRQPAQARALAQNLLNSKTQVGRVFARGQLTRGSEVLKPQVRLATGDMVRLGFHREQHTAPTASRTPHIIYRDPILLAADKPAGLLVHGDGTAAETLTAQVHALLASEGSLAVPQAVQRLDVETTGLTLFSLTEEFQPALDAQVAGHDMRKRYLAVVAGRLAGSEDDWRVLDGPIARDRHNARRMRVGSYGKPALTRVRTLTACDGFSLLLVELGSGRRHQIRVHLAHAGHPLVGDSLYGGLRYRDGLMLHAWEEHLTHPVTGERLKFRGAYPARFARLFCEPLSGQLP